MSIATHPFPCPLRWWVVLAVTHTHRERERALVRVCESGGESLTWVYLFLSQEFGKHRLLAVARLQESPVPEQGRELGRYVQHPPPCSSLTIRGLDMPGRSKRSRAVVEAQPNQASGLEPYTMGIATI